jgi:spore maturation protein SpmB
LLAVEALLEVKKRVAPYLDLQLVAFPQDGVLRSPGAMQNLERSLDMGVEVVGGIPHFERTMEDGARSIEVLCDIAAERGLMVDAMTTYGADSFVGRLASTYQGSFDTTFYILALYFGSVGVKRTRYAVTCGLIADLAGVIAATFIAYLFFH